MFSAHLINSVYEYIQGTQTCCTGKEQRVTGYKKQPQTEGGVEKMRQMCS